MKPGLFVDTGFWIALLDRRDCNHAAARDSLARLVAGYRLYVSDYVVFETLTYLNCSLRRHDLAIRFLEKTESAGFNVLEIDRATKDHAIRLFRQYSDKDFSVTDCTSFAVMSANGIRHFAGFDSHFDQMSFLPGLARE